MLEPELKLFESRSRSGNKKFRLHNTEDECINLQGGLDGAHTKCPALETSHH
jgi:hypothetical protein